MTATTPKCNIIHIFDYRKLFSTHRLIPMKIQRIASNIRKKKRVENMYDHGFWTKYRKNRSISIVAYWNILQRIKKTHQIPSIKYFVFESCGMIKVIYFTLFGLLQLKNRWMKKKQTHRKKEIVYNMRYNKCCGQLVWALYNCRRWQTQHDALLQWRCLNFYLIIKSLFFSRVVQLSVDKCREFKVWK